MPPSGPPSIPGVTRGSAREQLAIDHSLLDDLPAGSDARVRWWVSEAPALVVGFAQRARRAEIVDQQRCDAAGVAVVERRAGGGLVLLNESVLCLTVALPSGHRLWVDDVTAAYHWLGEALAAGLRAAGATEARRIEVAEARAAAASLAASSQPSAKIVLETCFAALSPHEVVLGDAKIAGLAQVRRQNGSLFVAGVLLRPQTGLADLVRVPDARARTALRSDLAARTIGLEDRLARPVDLDALAAHLTGQFPL